MDEKTMSLDRRRMYKFPWSKKDNPGGWVEVTDECDLFCPGCYRHRLEGHRPLEEVKKDILAVQRLTNCDRIGIAGGEPLIYPHICEVVEFISKNNMKPFLLTNGEKLTWGLASDLKKAGLVRIHFHVDSGQRRPNWKGKNEAEMNELRQSFADLLWDLGGLQCGYNITIFPSSVKYLPQVVAWARNNLHKVNHISLVAFRAIPVTDQYEYRVNGREIDPGRFQHSVTDIEKIGLTSLDMYRSLSDHFSAFPPCAYLNGTVSHDTYKFLIVVHVGSRTGFYGFLGSKTVELVQIFSHLLKGRYCDFSPSPKAGKKLFLLASLDKELRKTHANYLKACLKNPLRLFEDIYTQSISLQQPNELLEGGANLCDGCMNMMMYRGKLIHSCRLDEYRMYGGLMTVIRKSH
jgi:hypothetical protein